MILNHDQHASIVDSLVNDWSTNHMDKMIGNGTHSTVNHEGTRITDNLSTHSIGAKERRTGPTRSAENRA
jgi:hypothetical protein